MQRTEHGRDRSAARDAQPRLSPYEFVDRRFVLGGGPTSGAEAADSPLPRVFGVTNAIQREGARDIPVRLIDLGRPITLRCPRTPCTGLSPDHHPNALEHRLASQIVADERRTVRP
ncbi:MAG: hypothetical protein U0807_13880 [Candidatus Binatia bacterium]